MNSRPRTQPAGHTGSTVWRPRGCVQYLTRTMSGSAQKVLDLCAKLALMQDSPDFEPKVRELRAAIHQHLTSMRDQVADYALSMAAKDESKAAD